VSGNTAVVEQLVEAFNARDFARASRLFTPDYEMHDVLPIAKAGPASDGTRGMRGVVEHIPDARTEIVQLVEKGNLVVLHSIVRGVADAGLVAVEFINIFRVEDGRIAEGWGLIDSLELMRQLGVVLEPTQA
jgi:predicted SnoaL-like aldol condensation-catalyzing enzyme